MRLWNTDEKRMARAVESVAAELDLNDASQAMLTALIDVCMQAQTEREASGKRHEAWLASMLAKEPFDKEVVLGEFRTDLKRLETFATTFADKLADFHGVLRTEQRETLLREFGGVHGRSYRWRQRYHRHHLSEADPERLLQELRVYQVELEMQNEALRQSQEESQTARDKYAELYDFAPVGYLTLDGRGQILEANLTAATMLGVARSALPGTLLNRFICRGDQDAFYLHRRHVIEQEMPHTCDLEMQRSDGTSFVAHLESRAVDDTAEGGVHYHTILSDITALTQEAEGRRQAERLSSLGTFAAGLAHELNNPLYAISSNAEHAREVLSKDRDLPEIDDCLADILSDVDRCTQIVRHVLSFARQGSREKVRIDLHLLIQATHALTRHYAQQHGVFSCLQLAHTRPHIVANREDIELALVNLIRNAVEASSDGGHIVVETRVEAKYVWIQVRDMGAGLTEEALQRVFDPFYTTRQATGGTGLGLSLAHRLIVDHGGTIELQSVPGQGTTACVRLPLA